MPNNNKPGEDNTNAEVLEQIKALADTVAKQSEAMESQSEVIADQARTIESLQNADPKRKKMRKAEDMKIKDGERTCKFAVIDIELTADGSFLYFEDEIVAASDAKMTRKELMIIGVERTITVRKDKEEYLIGYFNCIDKNEKEITVRLPFKAISENKIYVKGQLLKTYEEEKTINEGTETKYIKNDEGQITDSYDIDLDRKRVLRKYDIKIITEGNFKDIEFKRMDESQINLL